MVEEKGPRINNAFYEDLGEGWYEDTSHPIALLRAENAIRNPWIAQKINTLLGPSQKVLDIGCGAGFLSNFLAKEKHQVTGIDLSAKSLQVAKGRDQTNTVQYLQQDAFALPFPEKSFDVVCAMDFLEHVQQPKYIVKEVARFLRPKGLFFFHTFNRNWLSWLIVIKGVEWFLSNTPNHMHLYSLFIKPKELHQWCQEVGFTLRELHGLVPRIGSIAFLKSLFQRKVDEKLEFRFTSNLTTGYLGIAQN